MSRIFVCGDVHGFYDIHKLFRLEDKYGKELNCDDYLIICGDSAICWDNGNYDKSIQKIFSEFPWTTIIIPGNHENYSAIFAHPQVDFHGARAYQIINNVYVIARGEVMTIDALTFFCFGGAQSHDKWLRRENESWWAAEEPTMDEFKRGFDTLAAHNDEVDFIITHEVSDYYLDRLGQGRYQHYALSNYLEGIRSSITYKHWFAGHHHKDIVFDPTQSILYDEIVEIGQDGYLEDAKIYTEGR